MSGFSGADHFLDMFVKIDTAGYLSLVYQNDNDNVKVYIINVIN